MDDYHLISGSSENVDSSADAATHGYADEEFKDPATLAEGAVGQ